VEVALRASLVVVKAEITTALLGYELRPSNQPSVNPLEINDSEREENMGGSETLELKKDAKM
jgi:hypothetical protein